MAGAVDDVADRLGALGDLAGPAVDAHGEVAVAEGHLELARTVDGKLARRIDHLAREQRPVARRAQADPDGTGRKELQASDLRLALRALLLLPAVRRLVLGRRGLRPG